MISKNNIIFNDIYGFKGNSIHKSIERGDWDNTKALIDKGLEWIIEEVKASEMQNIAIDIFRKENSNTLYYKAK